MYVCLCHGVSDKKLSLLFINIKFEQSINCVKILPVGSCCGKCIRQARQLIDDEQHLPLSQISEVA